MFAANVACLYLILHFLGLASIVFFRLHRVLQIGLQGFNSDQVLPCLRGRWERLLCGATCGWQSPSGRSEGRFLGSRPPLPVLSEYVPCIYFLSSIIVKIKDAPWVLCCPGSIFYLDSLIIAQNKRTLQVPYGGQLADTVTNGLCMDNHLLGFSAKPYIFASFSIARFLILRMVRETIPRDSATAS